MTHEPRADSAAGDSGLGSIPAEWIGLAQSWLADAAEGAHGGLSTGAPECGLCPICRLIAALRAADPAVVSTVVEAGVGAAVAAIEVLREAGEKLLAADLSPSSESDQASDAQDGSSEAGAR